MSPRRGMQLLPRRTVGRVDVDREPWYSPTVARLDALDAVFPAPHEGTLREARRRQDTLTKPRASLGKLEDIAIQLAGWQGRTLPQTQPASMLLFAADHPVARLGVSAYPQAVTAAMVRNIVEGGAAASVLAKQLNVSLEVIDVGVDGAPPTSPSPGVSFIRAARAGKTGDLVESDALDEPALAAALRAGRDAADRLPDETALVVLGEMGIGNTTVASALVAALAGGAPGEWVGPGTGVSGDALEKKRQLVRQAVLRVGAVEPAEALRRLGGRDIAALVGAAARAIARGMAVVVDGFIVSAAMLALVRLRPAARPGLIFAHRSAEPGHRRLLEVLAAEPLLDLELRLGEGTGALIALPLIDAACALHAGMATFAQASVPDRSS